MARLPEGLTKDGRLTLFYDEVLIIKKALRKLLFDDKAKLSLQQEMLIIQIYQKLRYKDGERIKNKYNKSNSGKDKG